MLRGSVEILNWGTAWLCSATCGCGAKFGRTLANCREERRLGSKNQVFDLLVPIS